LKLRPDDFEIVVPSLSILAEPTVSWIDKVVKKKGTAEVAKAYLEYLYTPEGQAIFAKHYYRAFLPEVKAKYASQFPEINLFTIDDVFGGWTKATKDHFADGALFDQIYVK
jgi:sulfate/thiosulfate transport system substrate-binding protein